MKCNLPHSIFYVFGTLEKSGRKSVIIDNTTFGPMDVKFKNTNFDDAKPFSATPALAKLQAETGSKTRITMRLDNDVLAVFKARAEMTGGSFKR